MKPTVVDAIAKFGKTAKGVISRLAYADLLKEAGRPTLIILGDALVHGDDQRLEQMKHVWCCCSPAIPPHGAIWAPHREQFRCSPPSQPKECSA